MILRSRALRGAPNGHRCARFALAALVVGLTACGSKAPLAPVGVDTSATGDARKSRPSENPVSGYLVTSVGDHTIGPFFARRGNGAAAAGVVAWVTGPEGSGRRLMTVPIGANGGLRGSEAPVANVSVDTTMLVARPLGGPSPGFLLVWSALTERGKSLWSVAVGDNGAPRSKPVELAHSNDDIVWIDVVPTAHGAVCVWAEETESDDATLTAVALDSEGKLHGLPTRVARNVVSWNALELASGVGISTVTSAPSATKTKHPRSVSREEGRGALSFHRLDADARETAPPVVVSAKPTVSGDVGVARNGSGLVFAWTDRQATEPTVLMTTLDESNAVGMPRPIVDARGGATLVGLASGPAGIGVLFESPAHQKGESRRVHAAHIGPNFVIDHRPISIDVFSKTPPEISATSDGFSVMATTRECNDSPSPCLNASTVATLFRIDGRGELVQREPLTFQTDPASLGWGLTCDGETCFTLAASNDPATPTSRIRTAAVRFRANKAPRAADPPAPSTDEPHIADIVAIASGERVIDIATVRAGSGNLVALLGDAHPGRDGARRARSGGSSPSAAPVTLGTRVIDETGRTLSSAILSHQAQHAGGVAIASGERPEDGSAVAWVAREGASSIVHVTRLDLRGKGTKDVKLATTKGDATDVTITWTSGGWIVAWIDSRNGSGQVYASRVSPDLGRIGREERITSSAGDASDLVALAHGSAVWLAWADSRESPRDGTADVFVGAVRTQDAKRLFEEQRVWPSTAHSRSPRLTADENGVHVAWIEEAPVGAATPSSSGYGAFWMSLDETGKAIAKPARIGLAGEGAAAAVAFVSKPSLRAVVARSSADSISLDAVDLSGTASRPTALLTLDGPPSLDVALALDGDLLFFNDDGSQPQDRRARRARITWPAHSR